MSEFRLLIAQFFVVLPLAITTWFAVAYALYWQFWWLDIPMHFAGGVWAGLCGAWILVRRGSDFSLAWCLAFALAVGIGWEIFEYTEGIAGGYHASYEVDTVKDIIVDLLGAGAGWAAAKFIVSKGSA